MRGADNDFSLKGMMEAPPVKMPFMDGPALHEKAMYQMAAQRAVMADSKLITRLSESDDYLPSGRRPATELMNQMLQKGGSMGDFDAREDFKQWVQTLSPHSQGRLMYHIADAAELSREKPKVSGVEGSIGPVGLGIQWDNAKDTHWTETGRSMEEKLGGQLDKDPSMKAGFHDGFDKADKRVTRGGSTSDDAAGRP